VQPDNPTAIAAMAVVGVVEFAILLILGIFWAMGNYALARRLGKNSVLWVILTLIPGVNFIFLYYVLYQTIYGILDRLPAEPLRDRPA
jgi:heme/copper-type cytochrome/quinol oxidase subunit 3